MDAHSTRGDRWFMEGGRLAPVSIPRPGFSRSLLRSPGRPPPSRVPPIQALLQLVSLTDPSLFPVEYPNPLPLFDGSSSPQRQASEPPNPKLPLTLVIATGTALQSIFLLHLRCRLNPQLLLESLSVIAESSLAITAASCWIPLLFWMPLLVGNEAVRHSLLVLLLVAYLPTILMTFQRKKRLFNGWYCG